MAQAIKTDSREDDTAALRAIGSVGDLPDEPTAKENLDRLRRNCR